MEQTPPRVSQLRPVLCNAGPAFCAGRSRPLPDRISVEGDKLSPKVVGLSPKHASPSAGSASQSPLDGVLSLWNASLNHEARSLEVRRGKPDRPYSCPMASDWKNQLWFGDNLEILRDYDLCADSVGEYGD